MCRVFLNGYENCNCVYVDLKYFCSDLINHHPEAFHTHYNPKLITTLRRDLDIPLDGIDFVSRDVDHTHVPKGLPCEQVREMWVKSTASCPFCDDLQRRERLNEILVERLDANLLALQEAEEQGEVEQRRAEQREAVPCGTRDKEASDTSVAEQGGPTSKGKKGDVGNAESITSAASPASSTFNAAVEKDEDGVDDRSTSHNTTSQAIR